MKVNFLVKSSTPVSVDYPGLTVTKVNDGRLQILRFIASTVMNTIRTKPDAIYIFSLDYENSLIPGIVAAALTCRRFALGVLDDWMRRYDSKPLTRLLAERISARKGLRSTIRFMLFHFLRRFACRIAPACITPSDGVAEYASGILRARRVYTVGRAVEELWFEGHRSTPQYDAIYVGRLHKSKGIETLLQTWKIVLKSIPNALLVVVGSFHDENYRKHIQSLVETLGLWGNIIFTGYIEGPERIRDLLRSSKLFIFPSKLEGYANAVAQAMAAGLPCIISDIPTLRKLYGGAALLVPPDEPQEFAHAIVELLNNQEMRNSLELKGIALAKTMNTVNLSRRLKCALDSAALIRKK